MLIPSIGPHDEAILPASQLAWLARLPDSEASAHAAQNDAMQLEYSLGHELAWDAWGSQLLKSDLSSALERLGRAMHDQIPPALDAALGLAEDEEGWKEVPLFHACRVTVGRATLGFTLGDSPVGRMLCHNEPFLQACYSAVDGILEVAGVVMILPRTVARPLIARLAGLRMWARLRTLRRCFEPLYRERMQMIQARLANEKAGGDDAKVPSDFLHMMLQFAVRERPAEANSLTAMTKRLAHSNFGTIFQSVFALQNLILNVLASDAEFDTVAVLRAELAAVFGPDVLSPSSSSSSSTTTDHDETNNKRQTWTRAQIAALTRADSATRETLRLHSFIGRTMQRVVVAPAGLTTPDGIHLPRGTTLSILAYEPQTDPSVFGPDAEKYDPFRFSRVREAARTEDGRPGLANLSLVATSADYLPWSYGRHACPGRFLVDFELKMILADLLARYEIELPGGVRPPNKWITGLAVPPLDATIRVRRRRAAV